jgi:hypothetical protein
MTTPVTPEPMASVVFHDFSAVFSLFSIIFFSSTFFLIFLLIQLKTTMTIIIITLMSQILFNKVTPFFKVKIQNTIGERRNPRKSSVQSKNTSAVRDYVDLIQRHIRTYNQVKAA